MAKLPSLRELPTYFAVLQQLRSTSPQCIWYKPAAKERCNVPVSFEDLKLVFEWLCKARRATDPDHSLLILAHAVRFYCCDQYHRDIVQNSGLDSQLARKWLSDLSKDAAVDQVEIKIEEGHNPSKIPHALALLNQLKDLKVEEDEAVFRPHKGRPDDNVASKLLQRISEAALNSDRKGASGFIYLFNLQVFQGMVKIGYTNDNVRKRLNYWSKCGHGQPNLIGSVPNVRYTSHVEALIHRELSSSWRRERLCKKHVCSHMEWFEIESDVALAVVEHWVAWINRAQPYNVLGDLTEQWKSMIEVLKLYEISVTSKLLLELYDLKEDDPYLSII